MKAISSAVAALALSAMITAGPTTQAKADGGAIAIGVGAYLLADAIVGCACHRRDWPFNIFAKIADEIHGYPGCDRDGYYYDRHYRHHERPYK